MNQVILVGRLGRDIELRYTPSGAAVGSFSMATNERGKDGTDRTEWHNIVLWGRAAESYQTLLLKGTQVLVQGSLRTRAWEKDGQKRSITEVHAFTIKLIQNVHFTQNGGEYAGDQTQA